MSRLGRFEAFRYIGVRDTMRVYDCDDDEEYAELAGRVETDHLVERNQIQSFAPDTPEEAANRGFHPASNLR